MMGIDALMEVRFVVPQTEESVIEWSHGLGACFGYWSQPGSLFFARPEYGERPLTLTEDGLIVDVRLCCRYYGADYTRGPAHKIVAVADWLERRTGGTVFYGSDLDDQLQPFGKEQREEMMRLFASSEGRRYYDERTGPVCPLCHVRSSTGMWENDCRGSVCIGCGWKVLERHGEVVGSGWCALERVWPGDPKWEPRPGR